jgi:hypothetical protein
VAPRRVLKNASPKQIQFAVRTVKSRYGSVLEAARAAIESLLTIAY